MKPQIAHLPRRHYLCILAYLLGKVEMPLMHSVAVLIRLATIGYYGLHSLSMRLLVDKRPSTLSDSRHGVQRCATIQFVLSFIPAMVICTRSHCANCLPGADRHQAREALWRSRGHYKVIGKHSWSQLNASHQMKCLSMRARGKSIWMTWHPRSHAMVYIRPWRCSTCTPLSSDTTESQRNLDRVYIR
ncbi:hypothetical protein C8Q72DRAFT_333921 [Fomitopsis betulina]|nr:hypothetical protein C8Q72DRAFT_333921 [Fomitopsis betulina]